MLPVLESLRGVVKSRGSELVRILNSIVMIQDLQFLLTADNEKKFKQKAEITTSPPPPMQTRGTNPLNKLQINAFNTRHLCQYLFC